MPVLSLPSSDCLRLEMQASLSLDRSHYACFAAGAVSMLLLLAIAFLCCCRRAPLGPAPHTPARPQTPAARMAAPAGTRSPLARYTSPRTPRPSPLHTAASPAPSPLSANTSLELEDAAKLSLAFVPLSLLLGRKTLPSYDSAKSALQPEAAFECTFVVSAHDTCSHEDIVRALELTVAKAYIRPERRTWKSYLAQPCIFDGSRFLSTRGDPLPKQGSVGLRATCASMDHVGVFIPRTCLPPAHARRLAWVEQTRAAVTGLVVVPSASYLRDTRCMSVLASHMLGLRTVYVTRAAADAGFFPLKLDLDMCMQMTSLLGAGMQDIYKQLSTRFHTTGHNSALCERHVSVSEMLHCHECRSCMWMTCTQTMPKLTSKTIPSIVSVLPYMLLRDTCPDPRHDVMDAIEHVHSSIIALLDLALRPHLDWVTPQPNELTIEAAHGLVQDNTKTGTDALEKTLAFASATETNGLPS